MALGIFANQILLVGTFNTEKFAKSRCQLYYEDVTGHLGAATHAVGQLALGGVALGGGLLHAGAAVCAPGLRGSVTIRG